MDHLLIPLFHSFTADFGFWNTVTVRRKIRRHDAELANPLTTLQLSIDLLDVNGRRRKQFGIMRAALNAARRSARVV
jgi:hypothetical protein